MNTVSFTHVDDGPLLNTFDRLLGNERSSTAALIACLAEVDARRLHAPAGYSSIYGFCIEGKGMSEDGAHRRIQAARLARQFPGIVPALTDGRLHLTAVLLLRDYLTRGNADELLAAAAYKSKRAIEQMLAERFPRPDLPTRLEALPMAAGCSSTLPRTDEHPLEPSQSPALARVDACAPVSGQSPALARMDGRAAGCDPTPAPAVVNACAPESGQSPALARVNVPTPGPAGPVDRPKAVPLSAERYALQVTISRGTREKLRRAEELLGHTVPSGDIAQVLDRALDALIQQLERQKCAATRTPRRPPKRASENPRHIPAAVKRAVRKRDGDRCTFVSEAGRRCAERKGLEYDHVEPVARGGRATVASVRLLCRAHNQFEAERAYGVAFMNGKRERAAEARAQAASDGATASPPWT